MALIKCTECGKELAEWTSSCPSCGKPVSLDVLKQQITGIYKDALAPLTNQHPACSFFQTFSRFTGNKWAKFLGFIVCDVNVRCQGGYLIFETSLSGDSRGIDVPAASTMISQLGYKLNAWRVKCPECNGGNNNEIITALETLGKEYNG